MEIYTVGFWGNEICIYLLLVLLIYVRELDKNTRRRTSAPTMTICGVPPATAASSSIGSWAP
jgi:hypothetical protein